MEHKQSAKFSDEGWELVTTAEDTPQQANGSDCGVFSCMFADYLSQNKVLSVYADVEVWVLSAL